MYNIKLINNIAEAGISAFNRAKYAVSHSIENPDAILVRSADLHELEITDNLLCIARAGAGTDNIPKDRCADHGVVVFNTPGANAAAVKELVICMLLLSSRDILGGIEYVKSIVGRGDAIPALVESGKNAFVGPEISGKTLGVIGLGAVGAKVANDAARLGMNVYGNDPFLSVDAAWQLSANIQRAAERSEIYRVSDYITLHPPYIPDTHHMINRDAIAQMKTGVRILNFARAELVNDDDIIAALESGKVKSYITDFPTAKTAGAKGVIALPHIGSSTPESEERCAVTAAMEIMDYLENGNIVNSVNMPTAAVVRTPGEPRLCIFHKNVPDMIAKMSAAVSNEGINIENMLNASVRGRDLAYTIMDLSMKSGDLAQIIGGLDGVVRVREV